MLLELPPATMLFLSFSLLGMPTAWLLLQVLLSFSLFSRLRLPLQPAFHLMLMPDFLLPLPPYQPYMALSHFHQAQGQAFLEEPPASQPAATPPPWVTFFHAAWLGLPPSPPRHQGEVFQRQMREGFTGIAHASLSLWCLPTPSSQPLPSQSSFHFPRQLNAFSPVRPEPSRRLGMVSSVSAASPPH